MDLVICPKQPYLGYLEVSETIWRPSRWCLYMVYPYDVHMVHMYGMPEGHTGRYGGTEVPHIRRGREERTSGVPKWGPKWGPYLDIDLEQLLTVAFPDVQNMPNWPISMDSGYVQNSHISGIWRVWRPSRRPSQRVSGMVYTMGHHVSRGAPVCPLGRIHVYTRVCIWTTYGAHTGPEWVRK